MRYIYKQLVNTHVLRGLQNIFASWDGQTDKFMSSIEASPDFFDFSTMTSWCPCCLEYYNNVFYGWELPVYLPGNVTL